MNHVCDVYDKSACNACRWEDDQRWQEEAAMNVEYDEMRDYEREQMWASF